MSGGGLGAVERGREGVRVGKEWRKWVGGKEGQGLGMREGHRDNGLGGTSKNDESG